MSTVRSSSLVGNSAFSKFARIYFVRDLVETIYSYLFLSDRTADRTIIRRDSWLFPFASLACRLSLLSSIYINREQR